MSLPKPYYQGHGVTLYCADALDILPDLTGIRLIVTDPPYSFGLMSTAQETKTGSWMDIMNSAFFYAEVLRHFRRLIENHSGAAWVFNSWRSQVVLARASHVVGWPIESMAIWDKEWIGPGGNRGLRPSYEQIALFTAGDFAIPDRGIADIFRCKWASHKPTGHHAEKPVPLLRRLIEISATGGPVLDAFAGSGRTLVAARQLGLEAIGIEGEEKWCEYLAREIEATAMLPLEEAPKPSPKATAKGASPQTMLFEPDPPPDAAVAAAAAAPPPAAVAPKEGA